MGIINKLMYKFYTWRISTEVKNQRYANASYYHDIRKRYK
jgi:hypothetical protein